MVRTSGGGPFPVQVATTGTSGFALTAGTPTIITYTAPASGGPWPMTVFAQLNVSSSTTNGEVVFNTPGYSPVYFNGSKGTGQYFFPDGASAGTTWMAIAGQNFNLQQGNGLVAGAATVYAAFYVWLP